MRDDFAAPFDDYQHTDDVLQDPNNYPGKIGNFVVNNLISLLPHFYTFYSAQNRMDPDGITVSKILFDGFLPIASFFQNPTELTEEAKRQATKTNCIQIQNVHNTILLKSNDNISTLDRYLSLNVGKVVFRDSSTSKIVNNNTGTYSRVI